MTGTTSKVIHTIPMHFHSLKDDFNNCIRLHRHGDGGDRFDMVPPEDFAVINKYMSDIIQDITEDDDDNESCRFCHPTLLTNSNI